MKKDFDDFSGLSAEESDAIIDQACEVAGITKDENGNFKTSPMFFSIFNSLYSMALLRKYHDWVNK